MTTPTPPPEQYGQHGPYPGQPYPGHPPRPPRRSWFRRHKILTGLGGFLALAVIGSAISGGGPESTGTTASGQNTAVTGGAGTRAATKAPASTEPAEPRPAGIGVPVRDGKFEFTVRKVTCGVPSVGGEYGQQADGQFCLVTVTVQNIGDRAQLLDASSQYAYDAADRKLSADSTAGIYANPGGGGAFLNEINPGNAASAVIVFDVPKGAKLSRLDLHDSPLSGGVEVALA